MFNTCKAFIIENLFEAILLVIAAVLALNSIFIIYIVRKQSIHNSSEVKHPVAISPNQPTGEKVINKTASDTITVDISGSVVHPGAYEIPAESRLSHVLTEAGGLNTLADKDYFARNYNSASRLTDQQKIYVPRIDEVRNGIFVESAYSIDHSVCIYDPGNTMVDTSDGISADSSVSINAATEQELDSLPSIGPVTARKIVDGRPYDSLEKLVQLKILSQKVFDELHDRLKL